MIAVRILIVEDNADILANLYSFLEPRGHVLDSAVSGYAGLALASEHSYDVIVLDLTLPGLDGLALCCKIRGELGCDTPVLMLTARDTVDDKVAGFGVGADDYLVKPFSMVELEVRLQALLRRARGARSNGNNSLQVGALVLDASAYRAIRGQRPLTLTKTGFILLKQLMQGAPNVVTREALEHAVWGDDRPDSDVLRTHIHALRQTLDKPESFAMLRTVPGIGFQLVAPDDVA